MVNTISTFGSGTLPADAGGDQVGNIVGLITGALETFQSDGQSAWQLEDIVSWTTSSFDGVWKTVGQRVSGSTGFEGDTACYIRIRRQTATEIRFATYQDWAAASNNASTSLTANTAGKRSSVSTTQANWTLIDNTSDIEYWYGVNEYEFSFVFLQGGSMKYMFAGTPLRTHIPAGYNGVARIITTTTGSGAVTLELDRNLSGTINADNAIQPGQTIWVLPQTPSGSTVDDEVVNLVTVDKVMSGAGPSFGKVNVSLTSKNFSAGSLVGVEPSAPYAGATTTLGDVTFYLSNRPDGGYTGAASQIAEWEGLMASVTETDLDPNPSNFYTVSRPHVKSSQSSFNGVRGSTALAAFSSLGAQSNGDRMVTGNKFYFCFPSITGFSTWCRCIGPFLLP